MGKKYTEAKKKCNKRWDAANLDRMSLAMPKGRKDAIKAHAASMGESMNRFINRAIMQTMDRDEEVMMGLIKPFFPWENEEDAVKAGLENMKEYFKRTGTTIADMYPEKCGDSTAGQTKA